MALTHCLQSVLRILQLVIETERRTTDIQWFLKSVTLSKEVRLCPFLQLIMNILNFRRTFGRLKMLPDSTETPVPWNRRHCEPCEGGHLLGREVYQNALNPRAEMQREGPAPKAHFLAPQTLFITHLLILYSY